MEQEAELRSAYAAKLGGQVEAAEESAAAWQAQQAGREASAAASLAEAQKRLSTALSLTRQLSGVVTCWLAAAESSDDSPYQLAVNGCVDAVQAPQPPAGRKQASRL